MAQTSYSACYHCKTRTIGCHGKCELYQAEKAEKEKIRLERAKEKMVSNTLREGAARRSKTRLRKR